MTDTPPEIEKLLRERLMARSNAERLLMGSRSFDAARAMVLASLPKVLSRDEWRRRFYERIYGERPPF
jgi:hypothetical protein